MFPHHEESIRRATEFFRQDPEVEALLLGGSIAHGFALENSDIDVMVLVSGSRYEERRTEGCIHFYNTDLCDYEGGYVDAST